MRPGLPSRQEQKKPPHIACEGFFLGGTPGRPGALPSEGQAATLMFLALGPLGPVPTSKVTRWFSCSDL